MLAKDGNPVRKLSSGLRRVEETDFGCKCLLCRNASLAETRLARADGLPVCASLLRKAWRVAQPKLHRAPKWLRPRVSAAIRSGRLPKPSCNVDSWASLNYAVRHWGQAWLDHWGLITLKNGDQQLISEPYGISGEGCRQLDLFCRELGLRYQVSSVSWWFPSETVRVSIEVQQ